MALAIEARYVMRTLQAHLTHLSQHPALRVSLAACLSLSLGACALVGIDPDEIDIADEAGDEAETANDGGETANEAGGTEDAAEGETGTGDDADTGVSSDSSDTSDPTTSDTSTDGEGTTGGASCEPSEDDTTCLACIKDACCDFYDACLGDANCACNLECLAAGGTCECEPPGDAFAQLSECVDSNCAEASCTSP
jgi:hypothetical protein